MKRSVILTDRLGPDILSAFWTKGQVLHRERAHLKVPGFSIVLNALLTRKLPTFLSRLNDPESSGFLVWVRDWRNYGFENKASYAHVVRHRTRLRSNPTRRRARDLTPRDFAPAEHSPSHDHEKWRAWFYECGAPRAGLRPAKAPLKINNRYYRYANKETVF